MIKLKPSGGAVHFHESDGHLDFHGGGATYEDYTGAYTITPLVTSQILDTADKHTLENITVEAIPYFEVSNPKGTTVIIGGNID